MKQITLAEKIARTCQAYSNCVKNGLDFAQNWEETLTDIERNLLPSGSGIDNGTTIDREKTNLSKIVLYTSFHHMDEDGFYDGWTEHAITVRPSFLGLDFTISGKDRNDIKDYLVQVFDHCLSEMVDEFDAVKEEESNSAII